MRRHTLQRQNIERGKELWRCRALPAHHQVIKSLNGFEEFLGPFIAVYYNNQRTLGKLPQENGIDGFRGGG